MRYTVMIADTVDRRRIDQSDPRGGTLAESLSEHASK